MESQSATVTAACAGVSYREYLTGTRRGSGSRSASGMWGARLLSSYFCKQYLQHDPREFIPNYSRQRVNRHSFWHHLFRHGTRAGSPSDTALTSHGAAEPTGANPVPAWQLEFLRLLNFEALEMTHTCCSAHQLQPDRMEWAIFCHPDPEGTRLRLAAEATEARKICQLKELMAGLAEQLGQKTGSPRDLEDFVSGTWRARVVGLYDVCNQEIGTLEDLLGSRVQTSKFPGQLLPTDELILDLSEVLPETLQKIFGEYFPFFDDCGHNSGMAQTWTSLWTGIPFAVISVPEGTKTDKLKGENTPLGTIDFFYVRLTPKTPMSTVTSDRNADTKCTPT